MKKYMFNWAVQGLACFAPKLRFTLLFFFAAIIAGCKIQVQGPVDGSVGTESGSFVRLIRMMFLRFRVHLFSV
jgi:hypothetical protein